MIICKYSINITLNTDDIVYDRRWQIYKFIEIFKHYVINIK